MVREECTDDKPALSLLIYESPHREWIIQQHSHFLWYNFPAELIGTLPSHNCFDRIFPVIRLSFLPAAPENVLQFFFMTCKVSAHMPKQVEHLFLMFLWMKQGRKELPPHSVFHLQRFHI